MKAILKTLCGCRKEIEVTEPWPLKILQWMETRAGIRSLSGNPESRVTALTRKALARVFLYEGYISDDGGPIYIEEDPVTISEPWERPKTLPRTGALPDEDL